MGLRLTLQVTDWKLTMSDQKLTQIQHSEVAAGRTYEALVEAFEHELGYLDPVIGTRLLEQKASWSEVEREVGRMAGPRGLMIIFKADQGRITSLSGQEKRCSLYLVGNPVIADQIISIDLRASFYVPFRVCLYDDRGPDGAVISYDQPSSFLAALGNQS
jgi:uncharacterized protein (DUF302 family)